MASYEIGVGLGGISKRIDVTNCDFKFAVGTMPLGLSSRYSGGRLSSLRESSRWSTQSKSFSCKPILTFRLQVEAENYTIPKVMIPAPIRGSAQ